MNRAVRVALSSRGIIMGILCLGVAVAALAAGCGEEGPASSSGAKRPSQSDFVGVYQLVKDAEYERTIDHRLERMRQQLERRGLPAEKVAYSLESEKRNRRSWDWRIELRADGSATASGEQMVWGSGSPLSGSWAYVERVAPHFGGAGVILIDKMVPDDPTLPDASDPTGPPPVVIFRVDGADLLARGTFGDKWEWRLRKVAD